MIKARAFKKWYEERQGHPAQVKAAYDAIVELEKNICIYARETIVDVDFNDDEEVLKYFADIAAILD